MDRLEAMRVFATAAGEGSLSAAGRKLGMPLATVSRKVAELERGIGAPLLTRTARGMSLTVTGRGYLAACRRILEDVGEAERLASGEYRAPRGELVVTAPMVFGRLHLVPIIVEFLAAFRDIDVRAVLDDRILGIPDGQIDVAIRIGDLHDSSLVATRVGGVRLVVCASPAYLARCGTPATPAELGAHACISFTGLSPPDAWKFGSTRPGRPVAIRPRLTVNSAEAAVDAALAHVGLVRVLSYQVEWEVRSGSLVTVLGKFERAPRPVQVVYARRKPLPLKQRAFLDFAIPRLRAGLR